MNIEKITLDELYRCYSTMAMPLDDELHFFFSSEEKGYPAYAYPVNHLDQKKVVWEAMGGVMSMIPLPNARNQFFAITDFYLKESPSKAKLTWVSYDAKEGFVSKDLFYLPYLHRFDLYEVDGDVYFFGCTIAHVKEHKEDWTSPGKVYVAKLPKDLNEPIHLEALKEGLTRNHGYSRSLDKSCGYIASDEGVFKVTPPSLNHPQWEINQILQGRVSEIAFIDIDHDGVEEMITIEPFHGNAIYIYKLINGEYQRVYTYPYEIDFAHTLVSTYLHGVPSFVGGIRRINADLFIIQYIDGEYKTTIVDQGVGPANLDVYVSESLTCIHSSNHTQNHAALYVVKA
jgi:hypothetical protein